MSVLKQDSINTHAVTDRCAGVGVSKGAFLKASDDSAGGYASGCV